MHCLSQKAYFLFHRCLSPSTPFISNRWLFKNLTSLCAYPCFSPYVWAEVYLWAAIVAMLPNAEDITESSRIDWAGLAGHLKEAAVLQVPTYITSPLHTYSNQLVCIWSVVYLIILFRFPGRGS